uniref:Uncharacterized protein n=1 Tax=Pristionchus pacificus TaxID=54126 RepID=A0A2A6CY50_PRIPA|eukprot:PDM83144.1 hypothetical protein PRIPAC_37537 [Pristionchus pacificus]
MCGVGLREVGAGSGRESTGNREGQRNGGIELLLAMQMDDWLTALFLREGSEGVRETSRAQRKKDIRE